jgi:hypothetical protein
MKLGQFFLLLRLGPPPGGENVSHFFHYHRQGETVKPFPAVSKEGAAAFLKNLGISQNTLVNCLRTKALQRV